MTFFDSKCECSNCLNFKPKTDDEDSEGERYIIISRKCSFSFSLDHNKTIKEYEHIDCEVELSGFLTHSEARMIITRMVSEYHLKNLAIKRLPDMMLMERINKDVKF
ncbi:MAG: hypothetical protein WC877_01990 [Dehalococcoidales bacterium]|jgi:hypothetical protein